MTLMVSDDEETKQQVQTTYDAEVPFVRRVSVAEQNDQVYGCGRS